MSTATEATEQTDVSTANWRAGALGGVIGALVMGGLMAVMSPPVIAVAIPSLYALAPPPSLGVGLLVHSFHGAVLGLVFAGIAGARGINSTNGLLGLGVVWGVVTWIALAGLLMPVWLSVVGSPASPPFPNFALPSLLWHVVYGVVLGGVYVWGAESL